MDKHEIYAVRTQLMKDVDWLSVLLRVPTAAWPSSRIKYMTECCWHPGVRCKWRTLRWITKGSSYIFCKQTRPHLYLLHKVFGGKQRLQNTWFGWKRSLFGALILFQSFSLKIFPQVYLEVLGCLYLFTSVHVFLKIPHSHDAFQAKCPATHKANLTIEEGLPHHKHLK